MGEQTKEFLEEAAPRIEKAARGVRRRALRDDHRFGTNDIVQEAVLKVRGVYKRGVTPPEQILCAAYLATVVRRVVIDHLRKASVRREVGDDGVQEIALGSADEDNQSVAYGLERVVERLQRFLMGEGLGGKYSDEKRAQIVRTFELHLEGETNENIAEILGLSKSGVDRYFKLVRGKIIADLIEANDHG